VQVDPPPCNRRRAVGVEDLDAGGTVFSRIVDGERCDAGRRVGLDAGAAGRRIASVRERETALASRS
jgi:hypothetical protein